MGRVSGIRGFQKTREKTYFQRGQGKRIWNAQKWSFGIRHGGRGKYFLEARVAGCKFLQKAQLIAGRSSPVAPESRGMASPGINGKQRGHHGLKYSPPGIGVHTFAGKLWPPGFYIRGRKLVEKGGRAPRKKRAGNIKRAPRGYSPKRGRRRP